jgi:tRNA-(ms[2]io[6]A)-hydroxylase
LGAGIRATPWARHRNHSPRKAVLTRRSINLLSDTSPEWLKVVLSDFDAFLLDHANCERKASALAMSLVVKYPDRIKVVTGLIDLAQEELEHFREVYGILEQRGLILQKDEPDPYIKQLINAARHGRDEHFIDRMLIASVIECRGAERFGILARELADEALREFYDRLHKAELKHGHQFAQLLLTEYSEETVYTRLDELMQIETEIIGQLELRPALH